MKRLLVLLFCSLIGISAINLTAHSQDDKQWKFISYEALTAIGETFIEPTNPENPLETPSQYWFFMTPLIQKDGKMIFERTKNGKIKRLAIYIQIIKLDDPFFDKFQCCARDFFSIPIE